MKFAQLIDDQIFRTGPVLAKIARTQEANRPCPSRKQKIMFANLHLSAPLLGTTRSVQEASLKVRVEKFHDALHPETDAWAQPQTYIEPQGQQQRKPRLCVEELMTIAFHVHYLRNASRPWPRCGSQNAVATSLTLRNAKPRSKNLQNRVPSIPGFRRNLNIEKCSSWIYPLR